MNLVKRYAPYLMCILPAIVFFAAGGAKLAGVEEVMKSFAILGLPRWFGTFIGAAEVAGAIGLLLPSMRRYAAGGLSMIMMGAVYFHAIHDGAIFLALLLFIVMVVVMYYPWQKLSRAD